MKQYIDYSQIKGVNYTPSYACNPISFWRDYDPRIVARELGYAKKLGFNCVRVFLSYAVYEADREGFLDHVEHLIQTAKTNGMGTMPVVFDACFSRDEPVIGWNRNQWIPNPGCMNLGEHFWPKGDQYCLDLIRRFGQEPSVLFWDVMNEPECTAFLEKTASDYEENLNLTYRFVGHYVKLFAEADLAGAVTVGSCDTSSNLNLERFGILKDLDVISFHDYSADRNGIQAVYDANLALGTRYGKAVVISEMGCPPRGNLYDVAIEIANRNQTGYFLWELMIGKSFWNHIHGVVYPDGTIRDTALVAALYGCFQNRTEDSISYYGNAEGHAALFVGQAEALLANSDAAFEECTAVLERMVHLTEGCQTVPLHCLPTTSFNRLRRTADLAAVKAEMQRHVTLLKQLYSLS